MKKKFLFLTLFTLLNFLCITDTYAYDQNNYASRALCGNFEVALFKADGTIEAKSCHSNYDEANAAMVADGNKDLAVLGKWDGRTKIFNANAALVDLTGPKEVFYIYPDSQIKKNTEHTYMTGASGYGGVDAPLLAIGYSSSANTFSAKIKISGYAGWVRLGLFEIVPLVWVKSSNSYTITSETIRHNYVTKIQNTYAGSSGSTFGPKPTMLDVGTYYSYDGHYFYTDRYKMVEDYKNETYNNAVNKDKPYYNYYQFLPQHTRTTYSSINIDEYVRNMGYLQDVYGSKAVNHAGYQTSRLYGKGAFFYNAQELYGGNALLAFGVSRNESGNGTSNISINKNNGFGLDAVDSSPTEESDWFPTFAQSIYDYNNVWVTYGYSKPTVWKYFGAQNGDKYVGMNVKYASDVNWGEKMASHYYFLDKAYGLQDYNYYQTAVTTKATAAYASPSTTARKPIYNYKSSDVALVLLGEVEGEEVDGNKLWYKAVSDMNIDKNFNEITSGYYNWDSYVYIPAAHVYKINEGKNGYISPNDVPKHKDSNYTYDMHTESAVLKPKVAVSIKDSSYYYDPSLTSKTGQTLLNDRYVMVYTTAYDENKNVVSYLISSDYKYEQKHWISADAIKFVTSAYGQASVTVPGQNLYTTVNPTTVDDLATHISGLYHYGYTPILEEKVVNNQLWYKVPVNLSGTVNIYGWTLAEAENVKITKYQYTTTNQAPVISANDKQIIQGQTFNEKDGVTANDAEDGNITDSIVVTANNVKTNEPGTYQVTYEVTDSGNYKTTKTITVTVIKNEEPVINATDKEIPVNSEFDEMLSVTASDKEDGNLTKNIKVIKNTVNTKELGTYEVTYQVTDSFNQTVTKTIIIKVTEVKRTKNNGRFDLSYLKVIDDKISIKGYSTIDGIDNNLNTKIDYKLIIQNINDETIKYEQALIRIKDAKDIPYKTPSMDGKDYQYSWFEGNIDISKWISGDYKMFIEAYTDTLYSQTTVNNQLFSEQVVSVEQDGKYLMTRNNYFDKEKQIELIIRDEKIGDKNVSALSNQYGQLEEIAFKDNKLYLFGNAFSSGSNLALDAKVERTIIFENQTTYKKFTYDLGTITTGKYKVKMPVDDKLGKEKAWYQKEIDIGNLPTGKYSIYIETKSNVSDIGELNEQLFRDLTKVQATINNKNYMFDVNYNQRYRVELTVS